MVSYVLTQRNNNYFVFKIINQAIDMLDNRENPLIHSDRGYQYTSHGFKRRIDKTKMTHNMSRAGKCIDNEPIESFWGTLKCKKYYLKKYKTFDELSNSYR